MIPEYWRVLFMEFVFGLGTNKPLDAVERIAYTIDLEVHVNISHKYDGAMSFTHLNKGTPLWYLILFCIVNQPNSLNKDFEKKSNRAPMIYRAILF